MPSLILLLNRGNDGLFFERGRGRDLIYSCERCQRRRGFDLLLFFGLMIAMDDA